MDPKGHDLSEAVVAPAVADEEVLRIVIKLGHPAPAPNKGINLYVDLHLCLYLYVYSMSISTCRHLNKGSKNLGS